MDIRALTHVGLLRERNEDYYAIVENKAAGAVGIIVADGMGGHKAGDVASRIAVDSFAESFQEGFSSKGGGRDDISDFIQKGILLSNDKVLQESAASPQNSGMGTTFSVAVIFDDTLTVGHVGDSRIYLNRQEEFKKITQDHSYIAELLKNGMISEEEAESHPQKNIITRALGCYDTVEPDIYTESLRSGDILLMCTDGLTNMVSEDEIRKVLQQEEDLGVVCQTLIDCANDNGGKDNITVIALRV